MKVKFWLTCFLFFNSFAGVVAQDTLRVMTYNVLHYGDHCQGSNTFLHRQLRTIVQYEKPDVLGLVKVQSILLSPTSLGVSPVGFADSILNAAMNAAYPGKYDHCPVVNFSGDTNDDMDLLYYDRNKLSYLSVVNLCGIVEDFNLYKLYYRDPNLGATHDTTFLYFILNHTVSGIVETSRDQQDSLVVKSLREKFRHLPNLVSMGDFNTHSSYEAGYQLLTATNDSSFVFSDPPFSPDKNINYPANWQSEASMYASYLNTSTRKTIIPNACGTANGAKNWYMHILLSPWIVKNSNFIKYVPGSYVTIGNDGKRLGISINDSTVAKNTSVPAPVLKALFQLSDKYPIMVKLVLTQNTTGVSPDDPDLPPGTVTAVTPSDDKSIRVSNPVEYHVTYYFSGSQVGNAAVAQWYDLAGRNLYNENFVISSTILRNINLPSGLYLLRIRIGDMQSTFRIVKR